MEAILGEEGENTGCSTVKQGIGKGKLAFHKKIEGLGEDRCEKAKFMKMGLGRKVK